MTFQIHNFAELENAVKEYETRDYPEAPLVLVFSTRGGSMFRVVLDGERVSYEAADATGAAKR